MMNKKGIFISFEGPDGSGKTSVAKYIFQKINDLNMPVVETREPGGKNNLIAEDIRDILLNHLDYKIDYRAEALLFAASRAQHVSDFILPNLDKGNIVLCDRYIHSSLVYQGYVRGLGINEVIKQVQEFMIDEMQKHADKGRKGRKIRAMIVGIPNVGKSSFINRITKKTSAVVGNKPGVTKQKQWIHVNENIELMDTPGVLWPKFENEEIALNLAYTGTIKDDILAIIED